MRICIDARAVGEVVTGLGTYARHLVTHLARLDGCNEYIVLRRPGGPRPIVEQANFTEVEVPYGIYTARNLLGGARAINPLAADLYHALFHFVPFGVRSCSVVTTLHDLIWVKYRCLAYEDWVRRWLKCGLAGPLIRHAVQRADHVIAISNATRNAAVEALGAAPDHITTIHHGVDTLFFREPDRRLVPEEVRGRPFLFGLGNTLPYKNCDRLIRAFARVAAVRPDVRLLMVGRGDGYLGLGRLVHQLGVAHRVVFRTQLSTCQVRACFGAAQLFAFPSLVEGFGLPILEAMASGCPVLTSDRSAPAEVASTAAERVDPTDVDALAAGMRCLLDDPGRRLDLARRGRRRAARFTWEAAAARTLEVYEAVYCGIPGRLKA